ncbi:hypothetical protein B0A50_06205 [Salinomyces thailandicus]|uniref:DEAD/DEAH box helicase n=1 Tax=Salinomyces thailandicus TaxID=706561 RepID=A0A4U0TSU2_9PEZI|nr:hypothetical protein B0A50_06205 [Salinomyces thailandica]
MSANEETAKPAAPNDEALDNWDDDESSSGEADDDDRNGTTNDDEGKKEEGDAASSDDDEEGADGESHESNVLKSYRKLLSRRVDLVGDYAGDELFLIEGDSMLLRCFNDDQLDFHTGLQLLHAVYNVEHLLSNLVRRKCNFHIVFFDSNRELCVPPATRDEDACKYLLARAAIIRHLQVNLSESHPTIQVNVFPSYQSEDFAKYLSASGPYFVMMHDGAQPEKRAGKHMAAEDAAVEKSPTSQRVGLRQMVLQFIGQGYNVALVNGLEWRDTKVMTMVLEARSRNQASLTPAITSPKVASSALDFSEEISNLAQYSTKLTERQQLAVVAVSAMLRQPPNNIPNESLNSLCTAFLLHEALLAHLPLSMRRLPEDKGNAGAEAFLRAVSSTSEMCLRSPSWKGLGESCDLADYVDGRLFLQVSHVQAEQDSAVQRTFEALVGAVGKISGSELPQLNGSSAQAAGGAEIEDGDSKHEDVAVLPFSNQVFDKHLEPVRLQIDESVGDDESYTTHRIFQELSHWHNVKRPIQHKGPPTKQEERQKFFAERRNQLFMAEMRTYAASLTNAVGKSLDPETIIVGQGKVGNRDLPPATTSKKGGAESPAEELSDSGASSGKGGKGGKKPGAGGKTAQKNAGKQAMLAQIAESKAKRDESAGGKVVTAWQTVCKNLQADPEPRSRFNRARLYLASLQSAWREVIGAEVELFILNCVLQYWIDACRRKEQVQRKEVCALLWYLAGNITKSKGLTKAVLQSVDLTVKTLGLPPVPQVNADQLQERRLIFTFALPAKVDGLSIDVPSREFQLVYCGPYLERTFDSRPDPRVEFNPDGWQRKVLDGIDANKSVFAVAPTSAGKTFISFYAMRKVLEADDDGVLVYVAPTKALVNQIAAEIQARYSKNFKYGGKSVWAIHTRDYRINNPSGCQVLVTVPHVLQIMLLAPSNANSWSSRVRRIIFDEVHSIGQAEDGVVWEQLLLMAPCPIIALSATVGNPGEFSGWLTDTQKAIGIDLVTVQHPHRYSDLRKYFYMPPKKFAFHGLPERSAFGTLGLEGLTGFNHVHPVGALVDKSRGIPEDLGLEPRDCYELWKAMVKFQSEKFPVASSLDPAKALPAVSRKIDILNWEKELKDVLRKWIAEEGSPYEQVVKELEASFRKEDREELQATQPSSDAQAVKEVPINDEYDLLQTTLPMLCRLNAQDALPAILFNYDRHMCEKICNTLVEQLQQTELAQRKSGPKWEKTLERFEEWKKVQEKAASKKSKVPAKKGKGGDEDDKMSKLDQQRDSADANASPWDSFDPEAPVEGYHFADHSKVQLSELAIYVRQLGRRNVQQWLIDAIQRGIGVHHAGMNRKYRQVVEILFRKGFLRVIIATGTLALGINMPTRTVVFSGDSVFLTALNFRQCAGRAGRRGFDLLGNVVFQGVSRQKVCRLISSRLPDLNGHFPITTTLVLRLFTLLHESKNSKYAVGAINALLSQPRLYMGGPSFKDQTMHHLRFSIEYLRRQHLLATNGAPLNFAGLVSHLYFTENSSFAFHALLKEGYFHELCAGINKNEKNTVETLMLVMAHLFNRIYCRQADPEYRDKIVKPSSSIVFLPPLPKQASDILRQHNKQTLHVYRTYVETFVDQHVKHDDRKLPLSGMSVGAEGNTSSASLQHLPQTKVRSPFVALSGPGDKFATIHDLCHTTRDGVFLEEAVIPHVEVYPDESEMPLNAWLLDFFKHGDIFTIEKANNIRRADIWFLLNDFSLVLATIITSLLNFMKLKEGTDLDMLDVMGDLDVHDEAEDNEVAASDEQSEMSAPSAADSGIVMPERPKTAVPTKKAKNTESWEEVADEEEKVTERAERRAANAVRMENEAAQALKSGVGKDQGLRDVLKAFQKLHAEFYEKFRAMWA